MSSAVLLFWVFAVCTTAGALLVIAARNPISSAMALVATFFFLAGIYVLLWAHTIAVLQVLVYAGAIMVLFLFVIMLLSLAEAEIARPKRNLSQVVGGGSAIGLLGVLALSISRSPRSMVELSPAQQISFGSMKAVGEVVYTSYLLPFEAVSLLLLVAIVGAVVVAKARI
jgi:NADH-quinone oxidoreductase subunit J